MNCYMNIPQCAEQAERIRQTLEALSRAHERIVETLRQLEDQTCPETIDALRRMESSLADMRAETLAVPDASRRVRALRGNGDGSQSGSPRASGGRSAAAHSRTNSHTANSRGTATAVYPHKARIHGRLDSSISVYVELSAARQRAGRRLAD